uniref:Innexin n=1 Tax=Rhabditophanes sp. KR3021 TaxID=114890 RepID=A0AC35THP6_9BILA
MDKQLTTFLNKLKKTHDDDSIDRINYSTSAYLLAGFSLLIMATQYVGNPIICFVPAEYPAPWVKYLETYCFIENTYYANISALPDIQHRENNELKYYQWIPYILAFQAVLCYLPKMIFKLFYSFSNTNINDLIQSQYALSKKAGKQDDLKGINTTIAKCLVQAKPQYKKIKSEKFLTIVYLLQKVIAIICLLIQFVIIVLFIETDDMFWGFRTAYQLIQGKDWRDTGFFPRVTFCDIETRDLGQARKHTIQCLLNQNIFIEKIYIFIWCYFSFLLVISFLNLLYWVYSTFDYPSKRKMVVDALKIQENQSEFVGYRNPEKLRSFIKHELGYDGMTVLRLVEANAGYVNMSNLCATIWESAAKKNQ